MLPKKITRCLLILALACPVIASDNAITSDDKPEQKAPRSSSVSMERLINAEDEPSNWLSHGRTYSEQRYSPLKEINKNNVTDLGLAWSYEFPDNRGLEATPLVVDGIMYTVSAWSRVYAFNAKTGELLWSYDPKVPKTYLVRGCCGPVNRGVAVAGDSVFVGTFDGYLVALDRNTGLEQWRELTIDPTKDYTITGAPRVVKDKVIIGNGGAEYGVRGYVSAYDLETGDMSWRFYTVPGNPKDGFENEAMQQAARTWHGEWWKLGGGGTVWDSIAFDPELNLLYIGVGNGSPWNHELRSEGRGDNLYLSSIVALDADTGEYVWHYQGTPGESWDFTATQQMVLADIEWQGETRKVIMQAPKNGFFFILDRTSGEFLSAEPFSTVKWASHYDKDGRPVENSGMRYKQGRTLLAPSAVGAHNWHSMSYNPDTGLVYIPVIKAMMEYEQPKEWKPSPNHHNIGVDIPSDTIISSEFMQILKNKIIRGELVAWDPEKQEAAWRYKHKRTWNGGTLTTAGDLVFQGTADHHFMAFDAANGNVLWKDPIKLGVVAAPMSYSIDGEQYIALMAKWGGAIPLAMGLEPYPGLYKGRLLVFKLDGDASLPDIDVTEKPLQEPPEMTITDPVAIQKGKRLYITYCAACHGNDVVGGGITPDLRHSHPAIHANFKTIVLQGALASNGMASFASVLSEEDADNVHAYILQEAHAEYKARTDAGLGHEIKIWFYNRLAELIVAASDGTPAFYIGITVFWLIVIFFLYRLFTRKKRKQAGQ